MAGSVNKVILVGNLGADPEVRRMQDGRPVVNLLEVLPAEASAPGNIHLRTKYEKSTAHVTSDTFDPAAAATELKKFFRGRAVLRARYEIIRSVGL